MNTTGAGGRLGRWPVRLAGQRNKISCRSYPLVLLLPPCACVLGMSEEGGYREVTPPAEKAVECIILNEAPEPSKKRKTEITMKYEDATVVEARKEAFQIPADSSRTSLQAKKGSAPEVRQIWCYLHA